MNLRPATMDDAQRLFDWRNDPATREASHNTAPLVFEAHCRWLERALPRIYIAQVSGVPVGTVRLDPGDVTELSWTIAPEQRGKGYGRQMVRAAIAMCAGPVRAEIKQGNIASQRIAQSAGMAIYLHKGDVLHFATPPLVLAES